jgi:hypothetical protein
MRAARATPRVAIASSKASACLSSVAMSWALLSPKWVRWEGARSVVAYAVEEVGDRRDEDREVCRASG